MRKTVFFVFSVLLSTFFNPAFSQMDAMSESSGEELLASDSAECKGMPWDGYSKLFLEFGMHNNLHRFGFETSVAFVPTRFGGYAIVQFNTEERIFSTGSVIRPLRMEKMDWHLFAGPALRIDHDNKVSVGPEIGFRLSPNKSGNGGWFGLWSMTASYEYFGRRQSYYTIGVSVNISSLILLWSYLTKYQYM